MFSVLSGIGVRKKREKRGKKMAPVEALRDGHHRAKIAKGEKKKENPGLALFFMRLATRGGGREEKKKKKKTKLLFSYSPSCAEASRREGGGKKIQGWCLMHI